MKLINVARNLQNIVQKLNSDKISSVLKVFTALVVWDCILIVEAEMERLDTNERAEEKIKELAKAQDDKDKGKISHDDYIKRFNEFCSKVSDLEYFESAVEFAKLGFADPKGA